MPEIKSTHTDKLVSLQTFLQFAAMLGQIAGTFIVKPELFLINAQLLAGNFAHFVLLVLSILFIYLGTLFNATKYAKYWLLCCGLFAVLFFISFYFYNAKVGSGTFELYDSENQQTIRLIKGDFYLSEIQKCAVELEKEHGVIADIDVIKDCADIYGHKELYKIWPQRQIYKNGQLIYLWYFLALWAGCAVLITGLQAVKCLTNKQI